MSPPRDWETQIRARLDELRAQQKAVAAEIERNESILAMHVKRRQSHERDLAKARARFAQLTEEERCMEWLRRQTGIGPKMADRIWLALGGAKGIWERVRSKEPLPVRIPSRMRDNIDAVESPPWNEEPS